MSIESFRRSVRRHGIVPTLRRSVLGRARRIVDFEICRVECDSGKPFDWPDVVGYETRIVGEAEFHESLCDEFRDVDYRWAFARGDVCTASFHGRDLVGYTFNSTLPTRARDGVVFSFPAQRFVYAYASATAPAHRGHRLDQDRWKIARRQRNAAGADPRLVWYVNVTNLESRAAMKAMPVGFLLVGHIAWARIAERYRFFTSAACEKTGTRFVSEGAASKSPR